MATDKNAPAEQEREQMETVYGNTKVLQTKDEVILSVQSENRPRSE